MKRAAALLVVIFSALSAAASDASGAPSLVIADADAELKSTIVTPALQCEHAANTNYLWCTTVQLAWNELMLLTKGPVQLDGAPQEAAWLNAKLTREDQVDKEACFVRLALGNEALLKLKEDLAAHFKSAAGKTLLPDSQETNEFIAYAYLVRNLSFATSFERDTHALKFSGKDVGAFSATTQKMRNQVVVHDYKNETDFVIELLSEQPGDRLLIARCKEKKTLQNTVESICKRLEKTEDSALESDEQLRVPMVNFELTKKFSSLADRKILNLALPPGSELNEVLQLIRFRLDENGAIVKSIASGRGSVGAMDIDDDGPVRIPRRFICNGPFAILLLKKDAKLPYFALWVANPELLVPYAPPSKE